MKTLTFLVELSAKSTVAEQRLVRQIRIVFKNVRKLVNIHTGIITKSTCGAKYGVMVTIQVKSWKALWALQKTREYAVFFDLLYRGWQPVGYTGNDPTGALRQRSTHGRNPRMEVVPATCCGRLLASSIDWFIS
jgi:hypothetical protein